jgi:tRNA (guanosine-2'-O-)-methyltransferase
MYGFTESYNISVSAALVLHDVVNRLKNSDVNWQLTEEDLMDKRIDWAVKSLKSGPQVLAQLVKKGH